MHPVVNAINEIMTRVVGKIGMYESERMIEMVQKETDAEKIHMIYICRTDIMKNYKRWKARRMILRAVAVQIRIR